MPSQAQIEFFDQLLNEKDFGPKVKIATLAQEFSQLDKRSASAWIEKAINLPKKAESDQPEIVAPSF